MTDRELLLEIKLQDDVTLSATSATAGLHKTLDYIPGSVLLGVAARHYAAFEECGLAWQVFHAGGVRFGNALPWRDGEVGVPLPLSRQNAKSQHGSGFVTRFGVRLHPPQRYRRRTAIDPDTGRALEMALFGYSSLCAGQSFVSRVRIDPACANATPTLRDALCGEAWIGRSRSAEYGGVRISEDLPQPPVWPSHGLLDGESIRFLAVTDCAFLGGGFPTAADLGLPDTWKPLADPQHTAIGWRRYAPFNFHRRSFDPERVVLVQGSEVTFQGPRLGPAAQEAVRRKLDAGVGLFLAEGAGVVLANPDLPESPPVPVMTESEDAPVPGDPLFHWLSRRHSRSSLDSLVQLQAEQYEREFTRLYGQLWREGGLSGSSPNQSAPGRAQWGSVRAEAQRAGSYDALWRRLFDESQGVCAHGVGAVPWRNERPVRIQGEAVSVGALLQDSIARERLRKLLADEGLPDSAVFDFARLLVLELATHLPRMIDRLEGAVS